MNNSIMILKCYDKLMKSFIAILHSFEVYKLHVMLFGSIFPDYHVLMHTVVIAKKSFTQEMCKESSNWTENVIRSKYAV